MTRGGRRVIKTNDPHRIPTFGSNSAVSADFRAESNTQAQNGRHIGARSVNPDMRSSSRYSLHGGHPFREVTLKLYMLHSRGARMVTP